MHLFARPSVLCRHNRQEGEDSPGGGSALQIYLSQEPGAESQRRSADTEPGWLLMCLADRLGGRFGHARTLRIGCGIVQVSRRLSPMPPGRPEAAPKNNG